jgi:hypothetical protein
VTEQCGVVAAAAEVALLVGVGVAGEVKVEATVRETAWRHRRNIGEMSISRCSAW